jgi:hypothetical protein
VTGMPTGETSEVRDCVNVERADTIRDSGAWKAGLSDGIIVGVRTRILGTEGGVWLIGSGL